MKVPAFEQIAYEVRDRIAWIKLNPDGEFSVARVARYAELRLALRLADIDPEVEVVVMTATGKAFLAGPDMKEHNILYQSDDPLALIRYEDSLPYDISASLTKTLICGVNGIAMAGGLLLIATSDISIAAESATFAIPEATAGAWEPWIAPLLMSRMSVAKLRYMIATGERIPARLAEQWGMITETVPDDRLEDRVREVAAKVLRTDPKARRIYKEMIYQQSPKPVWPANHNIFHDLRQPEQRESMAGYWDKRK